MDHDDVISHGLTKVIIDLNLLKEVSCYIGQRILRPGEEPINRCVRDEAGEVTAPQSEGVTSRRHGHYDMHVLTAAVNKV